MGAANNISGRIRKWFSADKEKMSSEIARGDNYASLNSGSRGFGGYPTGTGYQDLAQSLELDFGLLQTYAEYEEMDDYPELASALDVYADDGTLIDMNHNRAIWPVAKDRIVRNILDDLLKNRLRIEEDIWPLCRNLVKYGNAFAEILATKEGVIGLNFLPPATMRRVERKSGELVGFVQDDTARFNIDADAVESAIKNKNMKSADTTVFEPWEISHWRIRSKSIRSPYGHSVLEPARWIWRRLVMAEDTALVYKLTRAPARYAFYVDVGDLPPQQAVSYVNEIKQQYRKKKLYNPSTGKIDFRENPLGPNEDFWVPMRAGQESTRIDVIAGPDYQAVDDLEYFRGKMFSAIKVPRAYLGFGGDTSRANLSQEDVRFARTVMRVQRELRNGLKKVCRIHLAALGIDPDQVEFDLKMTVPSSIFALAQIELMNAQADLADRLGAWLPKEVIMRNVFEFSDEDSAFMVQAKAEEQRVEQRNQAATQQEIINDFPDVAGLLPDEGAEPAVESRSGGTIRAVQDRLDESERKNRKLDSISAAVRDLHKDMKHTRSSRKSK